MSIFPCDVALQRLENVACKRFGIRPIKLHLSTLLFLTLISLYLRECQGLKFYDLLQVSQFKMVENKDIEPAKPDITTLENHPQDDVDNLKSVAIDENKNVGTLDVSVQC